MDRKELKQILVEQVVPMSEAVQQKLSYLQSDDVFLNDEQILNEDYNDLFETGNSKHYIEPTTTTDKIATHKQSIAEKIATLRGISSVVSSEYYNYKR